MESNEDLKLANKAKPIRMKKYENREVKQEFDNINEVQTEEISEVINNIDLNNQNQVVDQEEGEETYGCFCWKFKSKKPKAFRRGTVKLANRLIKRRSRKKSEYEPEVIAEEKNDLSAATIAALCGK